MTKPSDSRSLGNYKELLGSFDRSFKQGLSEIPENIDRSRESIARIKQASKKGKGQLSGFLETEARKNKEILQDFKRQKRKLWRGRMSFRWGRFSRRMLYIGLLLRLFLRRYRFVLLTLVLVATLLYGGIAYSDEVLGLARSLLSMLFGPSRDAALLLNGPSLVAVHAWGAGA